MTREKSNLGRISRIGRISEQGPKRTRMMVLLIPYHLGRSLKAPQSFFLLTLFEKSHFQKHHGLAWNEESGISTKTALVPDMFGSHTDLSGNFWTVDSKNPLLLKVDQDSTNSTEIRLSTVLPLIPTLSRTAHWSK